MPLRLSLIVLAALGLAACADAGDPAAPADAPAPPDVRTVLDALERAFRDADMAALDGLWSADPDVVVFEQGGVDSSWAAYRDGHLGPELVALDSLDFRHRDVHVRTGDRLAVATGRYTLSAQHDGEPVESDGVFTTVFERADDGPWQIVHTHLSRPRR